VGENGSGKSTLVKVISGVHQADSGSIVLNGHQYSKISVLNAIHEGVQVIYQDLSLFLHMNVAENIATNKLISQNRRYINWKEVYEIAEQQLSHIGVSLDLKSPIEKLSISNMQLVAICRALSLDAKILFMDEPTTALDVTIEAQILNLMKDLQKQINTSIIMITHNLGVVAEICDDVYVMYAGKIMESADVFELFDNPLHPYTNGLMKSIPKITEDKESTRLYNIKGMVPNLLYLPKGCRFSPRCEFATDICKEKEPDLYEVGKNHYVRCFKYKS
jgi:oligopeptide/dipeptide ABC transporter ATP-binding protein